MEENWFWPGYCIMDMAFSFGADILFIPYDAYTDGQWSKDANSGTSITIP